jgi:hypothetical protein
MNIVYTALFGGYDELAPIDFDSKLFFYCFTDNKLLSIKGWEMKYVEFPGLSPRDSNRQIKFKPNKYIPEALFTIYVDSNIKIKKDLSFLFVKYASKGDIAIPNHRTRKCLYEEANACLDAGIIIESEVNSQIEKYKLEGFPRSYGLSENGIIFRKNTKIINDLMDSWWNEYENGVKRDQISLPYLAWKKNVKIYPLEETAFNRNDYFQYRIHKNDRRSSFCGQLKDFMLERKYSIKLFRQISILFIFLKELFNKQP